MLQEGNAKYMEYSVKIATYESLPVEMCVQYSSSSHGAILPPPQDWLCSLACKIKSIQIQSQEDLLPPLNVRCKLQNTVSHPGQGGTWARSV